MSSSSDSLKGFPNTPDEYMDAQRTKDPSLVLHNQRLLAKYFLRGRGGRRIGDEHYNGRCADSSSDIYDRKTISYSPIMKKKVSLAKRKEIMQYYGFELPETANTDHKNHQSKHVVKNQAKAIEEQESQKIMEEQNAKERLEKAKQNYTSHNLSRSDYQCGGRGRGFSNAPDEDRDVHQNMEPKEMTRDLPLLLHTRPSLPANLLRGRGGRHITHGRLSKSSSSNYDRKTTSFSPIMKKKVPLAKRKEIMKKYEFELPDIKPVQYHSKHYVENEAEKKEEQGQKKMEEKDAEDRLEKVKENNTSCSQNQGDYQNQNSEPLC